MNNVLWNYKCAFTILTSKENEGLVKDILKERRHIDERL